MGMALLEERSLRFGIGQRLRRSGIAVAGQAGGGAQCCQLQGEFAMER
jgi:hypothetical protein